MEVSVIRYCTYLYDPEWGCFAPEPQFISISELVEILNSARLDGPSKVYVLLTSPPSS